MGSGLGLMGWEVRICIFDGGATLDGKGLMGERVIIGVREGVCLIKREN